jgi:hypothetical protein
VLLFFHPPALDHPTPLAFRPNPRQIISALEDELAALHRYVADAYSPKFPELPNLVPSAPEFIRVCQAVKVRRAHHDNGCPSPFTHPGAVAAALLLCRTKRT